MALLCELVVDLKSTMNSLRNSKEPEHSVKESAVPAESRSGRSLRSKTQLPSTTQSRDKKRQPSFLVNLKVNLKQSFTLILT
jgi:hypothetical protein